MTATTTEVIRQCQMRRSYRGRASAGVHDMRCLKDATWRVVNIGPDGQRSERSEQCKRHAEEFAASFAVKAGWRTVVERVERPTIPPLQGNLKRYLK